MIDAAQLVAVRRREPTAVAAAWAARRRRPVLCRDDGKILVVAADHMARGALGVRDDPTAMSSRPDVLETPTAAGLGIGRALLYPPDGDVAAAVDIAAELVHGRIVS